MVQFGILGALEVRDADGLLATGGPRQRSVLARLLLDTRRVVSAERLIDDIWEGRPPASAAKTLQKYVSELRKVLPTGVLQTRGRGYVIEIDDECVDNRRFEGLVRSGQFAAALALWRGDVLADLPEATFATAERVRLAELRLYAVESRIDEELAAGRHGSIIGELAELVEENPLRERLTSLLMLALYRAGRQVEALRAFDRHRRRLADDVGVDPAESLVGLHGAILRHDPALELPPLPPTSSPPTVRRGNLPIALTSFVGRSDDLDSIAIALTGNRLVTLTGPGGVGKTRVAIELGSSRCERFPGGVWMVDLAGVARGGELSAAVSAALSVDTRHAPDELTAVVAAVVHRAACLVILDNCEHLVEPVGAIVAALVTAAPNVTILATSRRPLGVDGEFVRPIRPLTDTEALELFVDRGRLAGVDASSDEAGEICRRLDGLPLAIELAASQLRVLCPTEVADRLGDQLMFRSRAVAGPLRQRTLGDMVQWSYDLLPTAAQRAFDRLGVFAGTLTLPAAEAVCADDDVARRAVLGHVTTMVDHSLLVCEHRSSGQSRYRLLDTLRLFALERLADAGGVDHARRAHAEYFRGVATEAGKHFYGPDELAWWDGMKAEEPNVQAALTWSAEHDPYTALRLAIAVWPYWEVRWKERYGIAYIESLLDRDLDVPADLRAWALTALASMDGNSGEARHAFVHATEAVATFRELGEDLGLAEALATLGLALGNQGRLGDAEPVLVESLTIFRRLGATDPVPRVLNSLGYLAMRRGDDERFAAISRDEIAAWQAVGSRFGEATGQRRLALALQHLGRFDEAVELCQRALTVWTEDDDCAAIAHVVTTLADIARVRGNVDEAMELYDKALIDLRAIGDRRCTASMHKNVATIVAGQGEHQRGCCLFQQALAIRHELGDDAGLCEVLEGLAGLGDEYPDHEAAMLLGAAAALRESTGSHRSSTEDEVLAQTIDRRRGTLGGDRFDELYERGRGLSVPDIVDVALGAHVA